MQQLKKRPEEPEEAIIRKPAAAQKHHFVRCKITGPDGKKRPGWEMWLGEHCFGRSDCKESLVKSLERQLQPPQSFHWREVHRQRFERARTEKTQDKSNQRDTLAPPTEHRVKTLVPRR